MSAPTVHDLTEKLYLVASGEHIKACIFARIQNEIKQAYQANLNLLQEQIETKEEAIALMVSIYDNVSTQHLSGKALFMKHALTKSSYLVNEIQFLEMFADNLASAAIYKITIEDAKRFGL